MPGRALLMDFAVTPTSHGLADYRARGGYDALRKVLGTMSLKNIRILHSYRLFNLYYDLFN